MGSIVADIVEEYQNKIKHGAQEVYYKKDIIEGLKLIMTIVGIAKLALALGGTVVSTLGVIFSWAGRNPNAAKACMRVIAANKDKIGEVFSSMGEGFNNKYQSLSDENKKHVRTVVLLVAKHGIHWNDLH